MTLSDHTFGNIELAVYNDERAMDDIQKELDDIAERVDDKSEAIGLMQQYLKRSFDSVAWYIAENLVNDYWNFLPDSASRNARPTSSSNGKGRVGKKGKAAVRNSKGGAKVYTLSMMNGNVGEEEQYHSLEEALKEGDVAWYHLTPRERKDYVRENGGWFVLCEGYGIDGPVIHDWADEGYAEEKREALRRAKTKSTASKQRKPATKQPRKANGQFAKKPKGGRR